MIIGRSDRRVRQARTRPARASTPTRVTSISGCHDHAGRVGGAEAAGERDRGGPASTPVQTVCRGPNAELDAAPKHWQAVPGVVTPRIAEPDEEHRAQAEHESVDDR